MPDELCRFVEGAADDFLAVDDAGAGAFLVSDWDVLESSSADAEAESGFGASFTDAFSSTLGLGAETLAMGFGGAPRRSLLRTFGLEIEPYTLEASGNESSMT